MLKKQYVKAKAVCKVTFEVPREVGAASVFLVGDFNEWSETATPMKKLKDGRFTVTLELPSHREYQFRYLINGAVWDNDWQADQYAANPYGGENSVVLT
jgi:1,4-alpha-glucan branching enzyme